MTGAVINESAPGSGVFGGQYPAGFARAAFEMPPSAPEFRIPHAPVPIWFVESGNRRLRLARPFALRLSFDSGGLYFAENDALGICAHGNSAGAALADAMAQVLYFYDHYAKLSEQAVMGPAIEMRKLYSRLFEEQ